MTSFILKKKKFKIIHFFTQKKLNIKICIQTDIDL